MKSLIVLKKSYLHYFLSWLAPAYKNLGIILNRNRVRWSVNIRVTCRLDSYIFRRIW